MPRTVPKVIIFLLLTFNHFIATGQQKVFFDRNGLATSQDKSLYQRNAELPVDNLVKAYYTNGGALYFEGKIRSTDNLDEKKNLYLGRCIWYYKNGQRKEVIDYNESGLKDGIEEHYFENGGLKLELKYKNGELSREPYFEYTESGEKTLVVEENFRDNFNDWDLYSSESSLSIIRNNHLYLQALTKSGTSRFIGFPKTNNDFSFEAEVQNTSGKLGKYGLILGFKDWNNYSFFTLQGSYFSVGTVIEGLKIDLIKDSYASAIQTKKSNLIKILSLGDRTIFSINGQIVLNKELSMSGNQFGFLLGGNQSIQVSKVIFKNFNHDDKFIASDIDRTLRSSGTGFFISEKGYLVTNHHVVENGKKIFVEVATAGKSLNYLAKVVQTDKDNDLVILQIIDSSFVTLPKLKYTLKKDGLADVGSSVFTLGFPLSFSGMGKEVKFTDGKISSKTGFNQNVNSYQTTVPVQPGNSGGPLFSNRGELIGIVNAKISGTDNVSYAIKLSYLINNMELLSEKIEMPSYRFDSNTPLEEVIKMVSPYVVIIKVK